MEAQMVVKLKVSREWASECWHEFIKINSDSLTDFLSWMSTRYGVEFKFGGYEQVDGRVVLSHYFVFATDEDAVEFKLKWL